MRNIIFGPVLLVVVFLGLVGASLPIATAYWNQKTGEVTMCVIEFGIKNPQTGSVTWLGIYMFPARNRTADHHPTPQNCPESTWSAGTVLGYALVYHEYIRLLTRGVGT